MTPKSPPSVTMQQSYIASAFIAFRFHGTLLNLVQSHQVAPAPRTAVVLVTAI
jgi:uncharacterized membrane protein required for colicin V production